MTELATFDYQLLDQESQIAVRLAAQEIKQVMQRTAEGILQIGESLTDVQSRLAQYGSGTFQAWLTTEFGWSKSTAYRFIAVYERFGDRPNLGQMNIAASALYLLAADSTPEAAREAVLERAASGEVITHAAAQTVVAGHKPPNTARHWGLSDGAAFWKKVSRYGLDRDAVLDQIQAGATHLTDLKCSKESAFTALHELAIDQRQREYPLESHVLHRATGRVGRVLDYQPESLRAFDLKLQTDEQWMVDGLVAATPQDVARYITVPGLLKVGDRVTIEGNPIVGQITGFHAGQVCVRRPNPNGGSVMTHWIKAERVLLAVDAPVRAQDDELRRRAVTVAGRLAFLHPDGWHTYDDGSYHTREMLGELVEQGLIEAECFEQSDERLRITRKGCDYLGKPAPQWLREPDLPDDSAAESPPSKQDLLKAALVEGGVDTFRVVVHKGEWSNTYSAGFHTRAYGDALADEAENHAAAIAALGYVVINAGVGIEPGHTTLGFGGYQTPIVHFAEPGYVLPAAVEAANGDKTNDEWGTPPEWIERVRRFMGVIDTDPATNGAAQAVVKASFWYTKQEDGLSRDWRGRAWLNPPYSFPLVERFTTKAVGEYASGNIEEVLILVNNRTDAGWFHRLLAHPDATVCFLKDRINFIHAHKDAEHNRQGQVLFYIGARHEAFLDAFGGFGVPVRPVLAQERSPR